MNLKSFVIKKYNNLACPREGIQKNSFGAITGFSTSGQREESL